MNEYVAEELFERLAGADGAGEEMGSEARRREAANGLRHTASLSMTKVADGLIDPKMVLSWLLNALGAPAVFTGALVPLREAGALLPQVFLAGWVERMRIRKWAWVAGSAGQGAAALIVLAALTLQGAAAGAVICALLAGLAVARAASSVSFKDILGKTVGKTRRGAVTGTAGSLASVGVLAFAALLISGLVESRAVVVGAIALAAALWLLAAALFATLDEPPGAPDPDSAGVDLSLLKNAPLLWRFIAVRGLLVSTALAPPYMVILASQSGNAALARLGTLVLASAAASLVSSYLWGRMADRSSRGVLMRTGLLGALAMGAALALHAAGLAQAVWAMPVTLFVLMVAYHGVRQGRSTYLVDMAPEDSRAAYAAVANTVIGLILLAAGALGGAAALFGAPVTLALFALMALAAAGVARDLPEVETPS